MCAAIRSGQFATSHPYCHGRCVRGQHGVECGYPLFLIYAEKNNDAVEAFRVCEMRASNVSRGRDRDDRRAGRTCFNLDGPREGLRHLRRLQEIGRQGDRRRPRDLPGLHGTLRSANAQNFFALTPTKTFRIMLSSSRKTRELAEPCRRESGF